MILIDANLLIYAHVKIFPDHAAARKWLDAQLNGSTAVGLPWPSLLAFLRLVTNARIFDKPESMSAAWRQVQAWMANPVVWVPAPTDRHGETLDALLTEGNIEGNLVPDAHLAALAIEHGLTVYTCDRDFSRFKNVRWVNPLVG